VLSQAAGFSPVGGSGNVYRSLGHNAAKDALSTLDWSVLSFPRNDKTLWSPTQDRRTSDVKNRYSEEQIIRRDKPVAVCTIDAWWKALETAGTANSRRHDLRRTLASWACAERDRPARVDGSGRMVEGDSDAVCPSRRSSPDGGVPG
jgi:hypothetical protein